MAKNSLQWNDGRGENKSPSSELRHNSSSENQSADSSNAANFVEVLKSIGQDCTQQIESYLERCETKQEGE